jgi:hypothetical protein
VNAVLRVVRVAFIACGTVGIIGGLVAAALQDWSEAVGSVTSGAMILFLFWWFPQRAVNREF